VQELPEPNKPLFAPFEASLCVALLAVANRFTLMQRCWQALPIRQRDTCFKARSGPVVRKNSTLASERVRQRWYGMIGGC